MPALGQNHSEGRHFAEDPLIRILAEMIKSALDWEADSQPESDPDSSLNESKSGIDYPPTDPQPVPIA